jgi:hypothetical protein
MNSKWQEEFDNMFLTTWSNEKDADGLYLSGSRSIAREVYFKACEMRQKEIDTLSKELNDSMNFHCPNFVTTDNGYVSCNLDKHLLQSQLGDAVEIIQTLVYFTKKVCAESHEDLDLKRETLEKAKQFLGRS